jgi:hypothetical protein
LHSAPQYFDRQFLFLSFANNRERRIGILSESIDQPRQLIGRHQLLIIQQLENIIPLNPRGLSGTIRQHVVDD